MNFSPFESYKKKVLYWLTGYTLTSEEIEFVKIAYSKGYHPRRTASEIFDGRKEHK